MPFRPDDVEAVAHLARIAVDVERVPDYARDLSDILSFVERMGQVDTEGVEPLSHPLDMNQRLRPDEVGETPRRDTYQAVAPATSDGLYIVPRAVE